jgi:hypothetical protein
MHHESLPRISKANSRDVGSEDMSPMRKARKPFIANMAEKGGDDCKKGPLIFSSLQGLEGWNLSEEKS